VLTFSFAGVLAKILSAGQKETGMAGAFEQDKIYTH
jgi:hypothetical protein